jgi:hypothetical protein
LARLIGGQFTLARKEIRGLSQAFLYTGNCRFAAAANLAKAKLDAANTKNRIAVDLAAKEIEAEIEARKQASA